MATNLIISREAHGEWTIYHFAGTIDDFSEPMLDEIRQSGAGPTIFDFAGITGINSTGIADWLEFIEEYEQGREIIFDNCVAPIVDVINMVKGFQRSALVRSVVIPFGCENCSHEWNVQLNLQDIKDPESIHSQCPQCQHEGTAGVELEDHLYFYYEAS